MRLIDADALEDSLGIGDEDIVFREIILDVPTVNVLQKLWNALYVEEDKWEKLFLNTDKHNNWFMNYRPWLQTGFEIAIKVLTELGVKE